MLDDFVIDAVVKIANHPDFIKQVEPNVCFPFQVQGWMVKRVILAEELLIKEFQNRKEKKDES